MELRVEVAGLEPALSTRTVSRLDPTWYGGSPLPYTYFISHLSPTYRSGSLLVYKDQRLLLSIVTTGELLHLIEDGASCGGCRS